LFVFIAEVVVIVLLLFLLFVSVIFVTNELLRNPPNEDSPNYKRLAEALNAVKLKSSAIFNEMISKGNNNNEPNTEDTLHLSQSNGVSYAANGVYKHSNKNNCQASFDPEPSDSERLRMCEMHSILLPKNWVFATCIAVATLVQVS
jgi:hypothetical protein